MITNRRVTSGGMFCILVLLAWSASLALAQTSNSVPFPILIERADQPDGPWIERPAGDLPLTPDARGLVDFNASAQSFYRLRVEPPVSGTGSNATVVRVEDLPPGVFAAAQEFLSSQAESELEEDGWAGAALSPIVHPMYNPAMGPNPAYYEFKVITPNPPPQTSTSELPLNRDGDRGYIVVGDNDYDFIIVGWATEGLTLTETLQRAAGTSLLKIQRYDEVYHVAEDTSGNPLAWVGYSPLQYSDAITQYVGQVFEVTDTQTNPPPLAASAYSSYAAFKTDYMTSPFYTDARMNLKAASAPARAIFRVPNPPTYAVQAGQDIDILLDRTISSFEFVLDDEGDEPTVPPSTVCDIQILPLGLRVHGVGGGVVAVLVNSDVEAEQPIVIQVDAVVPQSCGWTSFKYYYAGNWSNQRRYEQYSYGGCAVGCGPVAWAMLFGWFDYKGYNGNLIAGGTAPLHNNGYVEDCIEYCHSACHTFCAFGSGATLPSDMWRGKYWATSRGVSWSLSHRVSAPCFYASSVRDHAVRSIRDDDRPSIIGIGCTSAHYPLAYGYSYRKYKCAGATWSTQRYFKCNMGWGGSSPSWEKAKVWYATRDRPL